MEANVVQWHVTWSTRGRLPVAPDEARRRALVRAIVERAGESLVLFAVVDDHVHVWLLGERHGLALAVRSLCFALRSLAAAPVGEPYVEPVETRGHSLRLLSYLLGQSEHHQLAEPAATWSGCAAPDLLGARALGWRSRLWDALPRVRLREVHAAVGLPEVPLVAAPDGVIAEWGVVALVGAATAAFAAPPFADDRSEPSLLALGAAIQLASKAGFTRRDVADVVGRTREAVSRAAARPVPEKALRTVRMRVALEIAVQGEGAADASGGVAVRETTHGGSAPPARA